MSCLFNSLQHFLPIGSDQVRQTICNYLEQNRPIIDGMETSLVLRMDRANYIPQMRRSSTWGGAIEIQAACNIWNMSVHVYDIRRGRARSRPANTVGVPIKFDPVCGEAERIVKLNWSGGHYTPRNN